MKYLLIAFFLVSCAHRPSGPQENLVSVDAAKNHAQASYLKGCVDAHHSLKVPKAFPHCREEALKHRQELDSFMEQDL